MRARGFGSRVRPSRACQRAGSGLRKSGEPRNGRAPASRCQRVRETEGGGGHLRAITRKFITYHVSAAVESDKLEVLLIIHHFSSKLRARVQGIEVRAKQRRLFLDHTERGRRVVVKPRTIAPTIKFSEAHARYSRASALIRHAWVGIAIVHLQLSIDACVQQHAHCAHANHGEDRGNGDDARWLVVPVGAAWYENVFS